MANVQPAHLQFEIQGERGSVSISTYREYVVNAFGILREYDAALSRNRLGGVGWYVTDLRMADKDMVLVVESKPRRWVTKKNLPDFGPTVASTFLSGLSDIEQKAIAPPYLSIFGMERAKHIASLIGKNGASGFRISGDDASVQITKATGEHLQELLPVKRIAIGAIEGTVEQIDIHRKPKFIVYESRTRRAVHCTFDQERLFDDVKDALGKRVNVRGTLEKNAHGDTLRVRNVTTFRVLGENPLLAKQPLPWPDPDFVSDAGDSDDLLRRIRGG